LTQHKFKEELEEKKNLTTTNHYEFYYTCNLIIYLATTCSRQHNGYAFLTTIKYNTRRIKRMGGVHLIGIIYKAKHIKNINLKYIFFSFKNIIHLYKKKNLYKLEIKNLDLSELIGGFK
jgi:hypothetical protein